MSGSHQNAIAGPSSATSSPGPSCSKSIPSPNRGPSTATLDSNMLFLPPPGPPPQPVYLTSTQDLLGRFQLLPAYDKHVRPAYSSVATNSETGLDHVASGVDKGKGREVVTSPAMVPQTPGADAQDGDDDEKGEKKKKNSYKHLIKGVPGKHSMKKDDYLVTTMQIPPKQRMPIVQFDSKTQRDAFSVSLEGLKGWNPSALVLESAQAREDRKKRKELKRLAKQAQSQPAAAPTPNSSGFPPQSYASTSTPLPTPHPTSSTPSFTPTSSNSARASTPRPTSVSMRPALPSVQVPAPQGRLGTPLRTAGNTPTSAHPLRTVTPAPLGSGPLSASGLDKRGKKRERDDVVLGSGVGVVNGSGGLSGNTNPGQGIVAGGNAGTNVPRVVANAKAGTAVVRPRPLKKQRMDTQGHARDVTAPVQQPTPQGV